MKDQVIKVLTAEHGKKVIEYWKSRGVDTRSYSGKYNEAENNTYIYYGIINSKFSNYERCAIERHGVEIITLPPEPSQLLDLSTLPSKEMMVCDSSGLSSRKYKKNVVGMLNGRFIAIDGGKHLTQWDSAEDIPEEKPVDMTMAEVEEKLGMKINIIKEK